MKKIRIIPGCVSCGTCARICPEVFEVKGVAQVKQDAKIEEHEEAIRSAAEMCPVGAIEIEE